MDPQNLISDYNISNWCGSSNGTINAPDEIGGAMAIQLVIVFLLDFVGLGGNFLSCFIIKRYLWKTSGTYVLFLFLAAADSLVMVVTTIEILRPLFPDILMANTTAGCAFHPFFLFTSYELSAWMILALTVERYLTIRSPFALRERSKVIRRAWTIGVGFAISLGLVNAHNFITRFANHEVLDIACIRHNMINCQFRFQNTTFGQMLPNLINYIHALAYAFIPYAVTLIFNFILLVRLFMTRNYQQSRRTTVMILLVTFSFIILTLPHAIYSLKIENISALHQRGIRTIFREVARMMLLVNHSLNFAFYMTGRQFRLAVHRLFCGALERRRRSSVRSASRKLTSPPIPMSSLNGGHCHTPTNGTRYSDLDQMAQIPQQKETANKIYMPVPMSESLLNSSNNNSNNRTHHRSGNSDVECNIPMREDI